MDIRYQEARGMMRTTVYARFRQQAALRNETKMLAANWAGP
jgi:hypothetical protein